MLCMTVVIICVYISAIAVIVYLVKKEAGTTHSEKHCSSKRYCSNCGRAMPFDANVCPYCGKKDFED